MVGLRDSRVGIELVDNVSGVVPPTESTEVIVMSIAASQESIRTATNHSPLFLRSSFFWHDLGGQDLVVPELRGTTNVY